MDKKLVITIDGPAGAGKSTVSRNLAQRLGFIYLDTGALYRGLAYKAVKLKKPLDDISCLCDLCSNTSISLKNSDGKMQVSVDGEDVEDKIRTETIGMAASKISTFAVVREKLLDLQREAGAKGGIVAEGRDMGSVVFPHADYKFYLDATLGERINRRHKELLLKGNPVEMESISKVMLERDQQDKRRALCPMKAPEGAIIIDSDHLSIDEVIDRIISNISEKHV